MLLRGWCAVPRQREGAAREGHREAHEERPEVEGEAKFSLDGAQLATQADCRKPMTRRFWTCTPETVNIGRFLLRSGLNNLFIFSKLREAHSRLYRRQNLQVNIRWKALDEI